MNSDSCSQIFCESPSCVACPTKCHRQQADMMPLTMAVELVRNGFDFILPSERIPLAEALGRIVSETVVSRINIPSADISIQDGIIVNHDFAAERILTGTTVLQKGEYLLSKVGNMVPEGYDTAIPFEKLVFEGDAVQLRALPPVGGGTTKCGSTIRQGEVVIEKGTKLDPNKLLLLRHTGNETVSVLRRPHFTVLPIGNDMVPGGVIPGPGQAIESDSILVTSVISLCGGTSEVMPILPDEKDQIKDTLIRSVEFSDAVITIGGAGPGKMKYGDCAGNAVEELGKVMVENIDYGAGAKAMYIANVQGKPVVCIPGPPHAARQQAEFFIPLLMECFTHSACYDYSEIQAVLSEDFPHGMPGGDGLYVRVTWENGQYMVHHPRKMGDTVEYLGCVNGILMNKEAAAPGSSVPVRLLCTPNQIKLRAF